MNLSDPTDDRPLTPTQAEEPPVSAARSILMAKVGPKDTKPEMIVRRLVHALGFRFRLHQSDLPGSPDLVFPRLRKVIFVHGRFWHRHQRCKKITLPKTRVDFWEEICRKYGAGCPKPKGHPKTRLGCEGLSGSANPTMLASSLTTSESGGFDSLTKQPENVLSMDVIERCDQRVPHARKAPLPVLSRSTARRQSAAPPAASPRASW